MGRSTFRTITGRLFLRLGVFRTEAKERAEQMLEKSLEEQKKMILADALYVSTEHAPSQDATLQALNVRCN